VTQSQVSNVKLFHGENKPFSRRRRLGTTPRVSLVLQELLIVPGYLGSPAVFY